MDFCPFDDSIALASCQESLETDPVDKVGVSLPRGQDQLSFNAQMTFDTMV